jgi:GntR family transcriptional regulator/MocR family aminotransferase
VAPAPVVRELRAMRRLMMRHVATNNQQAAASFIAHGYHEAYVRRLNLAYRERARVLAAALAEHAPQLQTSAARGGSALWVQGPPGLDTSALAERLLAQGVVVEPGSVFYADPPAACNAMRIGYSSIAVDRIDEGVRVIARELTAVRGR